MFFIKNGQFPHNQVNNVVSFLKHNRDQGQVMSLYNHLLTIMCKIAINGHE